MIDEQKTLRLATVARKVLLLRVISPTLVPRAGRSYGMLECQNKLPHSAGEHISCSVQIAETLYGLSFVNQGFAVNKLAGLVEDSRSENADINSRKKIADDEARTRDPVVGSEDLKKITHWFLEYAFG
jgi:hypothetical protein